MIEIDSECHCNVTFYPPIPRAGDPTETAWAVFEWLEAKVMAAPELWGGWELLRRMEAPKGQRAV